MNTSPVSGWEAERERLRKALEQIADGLHHIRRVHRWSEAQRIARAVLSESKEQTTADGWIEWKGGECPVAGNVLVERKYRGNPGVRHTADEATCFDWSHDPRMSDSDIIAYRVVTP